MGKVDKMIEINNVLSKTLFNKLKTYLCSDTVPWYYSDNSAYGPSSLTENILTDEERKKYLYHSSFAHLPFANGSSNSPQSLLFETCVLSALDKAEVEVEKLLRIRAGLILGSPNPVVHAPHVDLEFPHKTALLYMTSCNGETLIYNEKCDFNLKQDMFKQIQKLNNQFTVKDTIKSEENKLVVFDGAHFHSSSNPSDVSSRIVLTINFL